MQGARGWSTSAASTVEVNEFDYKGENAVIYEENGVTIRSFPAIHSIDGPVSFSLEWNGLKFVFSSDSFPNKWFVEYAKDADIAIHECFVAVPDIVSEARNSRRSPPCWWAPRSTPRLKPSARSWQEVKPRIAVAYHFFKDSRHDRPSERSHSQNL